MYQICLYEYIRTFVRPSVDYLAHRLDLFSRTNEYKKRYKRIFEYVRKLSRMLGSFQECPKSFQTVLKYSRQLETVTVTVTVCTVQTVGKLTRLSGNFLDCFSVWKIFQTEKSFQTRKNFLDVQKLYCVLCICIIDCTKQACVCT